MFDKFKSWLNALYDELTAVNETPHRVALSFALGVFLGILPFTGILAAISLAWFFRLNKAAAILGSAITNTWLGLLVLGAAIKLGAMITGAKFDLIKGQVDALFRNFSFDALFHSDILSLFICISFGYLIIGLGFALLGYILAILVLHWQRKNIKT